jgi:hypothetical protein
MVLAPRKRQGRGQPLEREKLEPHTLRLPACGAAPIGAAAVVLAGPRALAPFLPGLEGLASHLPPGTLAHTGASAVLGVGAALLFAWLFNRPPRVMEIWRRWPGEPIASDLAATKLREATFKSVIFILVVIIGDALLAASVGGVDLPPVLGVVVGTAIVLDLAREWHARSGKPDLVPVWPVHRVYAVDAARALLARAGIEAFPRGVHHRALLHFFGPHVAVDLLVPARHADEASRLLEELLLGQNQINRPRDPRQAAASGADH